MPVAPVCQYCQKVNMLVLHEIDTRKQQATNCRYEISEGGRCSGDGRRERRRKCRLVWGCDAVLRNTADILAEWWETRHGWTEGGRWRAMEKRGVEGQPQPHVKCGTDIWTAPALLLLFHSVHNFSSIHSAYTHVCSGTMVSVTHTPSFVIFPSHSLPPFDFDFCSSLSVSCLFCRVPLLTFTFVSPASSTFLPFFLSRLSFWWLVCSDLVFVAVSWKEKVSRFLRWEKNLLENLFTSSDGKFEKY